MYALYWDVVMDWGMMQDPYKAAQTACRLGYVPAATSSGCDVKNGADGILVVPDDNTITTNNTTTITNGKGHDHADHYQYQSCHHVCLRPRLRFGLVLSTLIVVADSLLRFSWLLRFVAKFPSNDAFVLCTQFLEVFRRAIWNLLRVEWENIKQKNHDAKGKKSIWKDDDEAGLLADEATATPSSSNNATTNTTANAKNTTTTNRGRKFSKQLDHDDDHQNGSVEMKNLL